MFVRIACRLLAHRPIKSVSSRLRCDEAGLLPLHAKGFLKAGPLLGASQSDSWEPFRIVPSFDFLKAVCPPYRTRSLQNTRTAPTRLSQLQPSFQQFRERPTLLAPMIA